MKLRKTLLILALVAVLPLRASDSLKLATERFYVSICWQVAYVSGPHAHEAMLKGRTIASIRSRTIPDHLDEEVRSITTDIYSRMIDTIFLRYNTDYGKVAGIVYDDCVAQGDKIVPRLVTYRKNNGGE